MWNVDSGDSNGVSGPNAVRIVITGLHPGAIVLMHETHEDMVDGLDRNFAEMRKRGLRAVTVPELLAADPPSEASLAKPRGGCRGYGSGVNG